MAAKWLSPASSVASGVWGSGMALSARRNGQSWREFRESARTKQEHVRRASPELRRGLCLRRSTRSLAMTKPLAGRRIAVLMGGLSPERDISLVTGKACAEALERLGAKVDLIDAGRDIGDV